MSTLLPLSNGQSLSVYHRGRECKQHVSELIPLELPPHPPPPPPGLYHTEQHNVGSSTTPPAPPPPLRR